MKMTRQKLIPLLFSLAIVLLDQITKALVVKFIPPYSIGASLFGDFLQIIHVTNKGVAFSLGSSANVAFRQVLFCFAPVIVIAIVIVVYLRNDDFPLLQRFAIAGIVGGGLGNLVDRFFRSEGVVDFVSVKFYGLFGFERWPTFNIADSAVVVCGFMLLISFMIAIIKTAPIKKAAEEE